MSRYTLVDAWIAAHLQAHDRPADLNYNSVPSDGLHAAYEFDEINSDGYEPLSEDEFADRLRAAGFRVRDAHDDLYHSWVCCDWIEECSLEWRPITDESPPVGQRVLVLSEALDGEPKHWIECAKRDSFQHYPDRPAFTFDQDLTAYHYRPTHWMPLPKLPKG